MAQRNKPMRSNSQPPPPVINVYQQHGTSQSSVTTFDRNTLSPNMSANTYQRRLAIHTDYGKSPVSMSPHDNMIKFDYNVFVTTWQDQIKMRQYDNCEKYCREVIDRLLAAEDKQQLIIGFGLQKQSEKRRKQSNAIEENVHSLLEYRSKVHFSLAYLLKKYFKRYDEAKQQYEESIRTDAENPGAHFNLANMLVDHYKDYDTAQFHFERSIVLEPTYILYRMTYAEFLWHDVGRHKESANQYEELIKTNADNPDIYFNYALLLRDHLDDLEESINQFEKVMSLNPDDNEAQEEYEYTVRLSNEADAKDTQDEEMDKVEFNEEMSYNQQVIEYQNSRKKNSTFRRSQHEINLSIKPDEDDIQQKYHQVLDEKNKLNALLHAQNEKLTTIEQILNENDNFRKSLKLLVKNGANYVEVNAKNAHKILSLCSDVIHELDDLL